MVPACSLVNSNKEPWLYQVVQPWQGKQHALNNTKKKKTTRTQQTTKPHRPDHSYCCDAQHNIKILIYKTKYTTLASQSISSSSAMYIPILQATNTWQETSKLRHTSTASMRSYLKPSLSPPKNRQSCTRTTHSFNVRTVG